MPRRCKTQQTQQKRNKNKTSRAQQRQRRATRRCDDCCPAAARGLLGGRALQQRSGLVRSGLWSTSGTLTSGSRRQAKRGASSRLSQGKQAKGPDASHSFRASWPGLGLGWAGRSTAQRLGSSPKRPVARGIIHSSASCMATHARRTRSRARRR
jgi:hypothetical protein